MQVGDDLAEPRHVQLVSARGSETESPESSERTHGANSVPTPGPQPRPLPPPPHPPAHLSNDCDYIYETAKSSGQAFRGHNLAWGNYNPSWVDALSPSEKKDALVEYVSTVAARYPDAYAWDVYNEPVCDGGFGAKIPPTHTHARATPGTQREHGPGRVESSRVEPTLKTVSPHATPIPDFPFAAAAGLEICDGTEDGLNAIYKNSSW